MEQSVCRLPAVLFFGLHGLFIRRYITRCAHQQAKNDSALLQRQFLEAIFQKEKKTVRAFLLFFLCKCAGPMWAAL